MTVFQNILSRDKWNNHATYVTVVQNGGCSLIIYSMEWVSEWVRFEWQNPWWFWGEIIEIQDDTSLMKCERDTCSNFTGAGCELIYLFGLKARKNNMPCSDSACKPGPAQSSFYRPGRAKACPKILNSKGFNENQ